MGPASATLAPGLYHNVTAGPRATLALSAGTYLIDALTLGPNTTLNIDTSAGTVYLYVTGRTTLNSTVIGDARRFVLGHLGTEGATVSGSFRGTLLAPNASLTLGPQQTYEATVFAKRLTVGPGVTVKKIETPFLIGELKIAKETLCAGEQTEVTLSTGAPTVPGVTPRIMGAIGTRQYVEFSGAPGPRTVFATLTTSDGRADHVSSPVQVQQCGASDAATRVHLHFKGARGIPNGAELAVFQYDTNGHPVPVTPGSSYEWTFGDGKTLSTTVPVVTHDYSSAIDPFAEYSSFTASVVVRSASRTASAKKVVSLWNLYAKNRSKGIIQPPSTLTLAEKNYAVRLKNYEKSPLSLTSAFIELMPCDPTLPIRRQPTQTLQVTVPAEATASVGVTAPDTIPRDVCFVGAHVIGHGTAGVVYGDAYAKVRSNPLQTVAVNDAETIQLLNRASTMTRDPNRFSSLELAELLADGRIDRLPTGSPARTVYADPTAGDTCEPGDVKPTDGLECQPTAEWVREVGVIVNAFRGDILMDHSCGAIGELITALNQNYSHDSIVVHRSGSRPPRSSPMSSRSAPSTVLRLPLGRTVAKIEPTAWTLSADTMADVRWICRRIAQERSPH